MTEARRFEDLIAWQKARILTRMVYEVSRNEPLNKDFALRDQLRRATVSMMANIAEGHARDGNAEFRQFLSMAKGSVAEVQSHLYIASDTELITMAQFEQIYAQAAETARLIAGLMNHLKQSELKGSKYR